jgi:hypothetical protein
LILTFYELLLPAKKRRLHNIVLLEKGECQQTSTPLKVGAAPGQKNTRMKKEKIKNYKLKILK